LSAAEGGAENRFRAKVDGRIYHGDHQRLLARLSSGQVLTVKIDADAALATGDTVDICWRASECRAFPTGATTSAST
jgi:putative spermidine/putrescine transport system ATP-binding protein